MTNTQPYPMVHPLTFMQNPLIQALANDPCWTLSDIKKRPIHAKRFLETGVIENATFDERSPMVTLPELDAVRELEAVNRAYRLHARENRVIVIDVEPEAPDAYKRDVLHFPAHYTELSTNGGIHLLICVPEDCITDDNRYLFDDLSVFKEPVPKGQNRSAYYEVIFNDHFITFTKRMVTEKAPADFVNNAEQKAKLIGFLNNVVALDKARKLERERAKKYQVELFEGAITDKKKEIIQQFIDLKPFDVAKQQANEKQPSDFGEDLSRYEMSVASGLASHVLRIHSLAKGTQSFNQLANALKDQDLIYATYLLAKEVIPYRDKHEEIRDHLPWLMYTAKRAYEYIKANNAKK